MSVEHDASHILWRMHVILWRMHETDSIPDGWDEDRYLAAVAYLEEGGFFAPVKGKRKKESHRQKTDAPSAHHSEEDVADLPLYRKDK